MDIITRTIQDAVPMSNPLPFAKRWWSHDLATENKKIKALGKLARRKCHIRDHPIHEEYRAACNDFTEKVEKNKLDHWTEYLEETDTHSIWTTHKYLMDEPSDHFISRIPTLHRNNTTDPPTDQTNQEKSALLYEAFFKPP